MKLAPILAVVLALTVVLSGASAVAFTKQSTAEALPTAEVIASAVPRDLVIDHRGLGYLRGVDGSLTPYGHGIAAEKRPVGPRAPGGIPGPPGGGGRGGGDVVTHAHWTLGEAVKNAAGRILFTFDELTWYVCSGTVVTDGVTQRSIVMTAAHCIFDDVAKEFTTTAIFIPRQDDGGIDNTDWDCTNDIYGCWTLDHGVVDVNWTTRTFPDNIPWDYGFYVVSDTGAHTQGALQTDDDLDGVVGSLAPDFSPPSVGDTTHALGYSYAGNYDPNLMYCAEAMSTKGSANYWLGRCDLTGGSSGGPWVQPMDESTGSDPIISLNSWGYTFQSGMAGPKLHDNSAVDLFEHAKNSPLSSDGEIVDPPGGGGGGDYTTSSINNGPTWTAIVEHPGGVYGSFTGGPECSGETTCAMSGIPKKMGSVTFDIDDGQTLTVYKP